MIRPAKLSDIPAIVELAVESVTTHPLPLKNDLDAVAAMARSLIGNPAHFVWVGEVDGKVVSCVAAQVGPGFWFRGLQASVLLYYARPPGSVALLMRRLSKWMHSRSGIKMGIVELEPTTDPRLVALLSKIGFARHSVNATYVRSK
jgi:hypothetical protein